MENLIGSAALVKNGPLSGCFGRVVRVEQSQVLVAFPFRDEQRMVALPVGALSLQPIGIRPL